MDRIVCNENGTLDKFAVPEKLHRLIMALDKHHDWIKGQTLSDKLTINVNFPEEGKTISITW